MAPGGLGRPSSVTVPSRFAEAGRVTVRSGPADTDGAALVGGVPPLVYSTWSSGAKVPFERLGGTPAAAGDLHRQGVATGPTPAG